MKKKKAKPWNNITGSLCLKHIQYGSKQTCISPNLEKICWVLTTAESHLLGRQIWSNEACCSKSKRLQTHLWAPHGNYKTTTVPYLDICSYLSAWPGDREWFCGLEMPEMALTAAVLFDLIWSARFRFRSGTAFLYMRNRFLKTTLKPQENLQPFLVLP